MEDYQAQETVVDAPVDAEQELSQETIEETHTDAGETVVTEAVDAPKPDANVGEAIKREVDRREAQFRKQYEQQTKDLERVAKYYGFDSPESYLQAIDQAEQDRLVQEEADRLGVPEDFIRSELQPLKGELEQLRQEREQLRMKEQQIQINAELTELRTKYNDFDSYNGQIFDLVTNKGYGLEHAYMVASFQDKIANTRKQAEAETIRNLQQNAESSTGALSQGDVDHKTGFANLSREEQRRMIAEVKSGTRKTLS